MNRDGFYQKLELVAHYIPMKLSTTSIEQWDEQVPETRLPIHSLCHMCDEPGNFDSHEHSIKVLTSLTFQLNW